MKDEEGYSVWPEGDGQHLLSKTPVWVKLHIDHCDNPDKDVWAVQFGDNYFTAHGGEVFAPLSLIFSAEGEQPRAFLYGLARVQGWREGDRREIYLV